MFNNMKNDNENTENHPFDRFKVIEPINSNSFLEFEKVFHISHIENSVNIIKNKKIQNHLVFDKSKLRDKRILVVWLSPNKWPGYLYGEIRFTLDWKQLISGKKFYWVEYIEEYNPTACRILITNNEYDYLIPYNPEDKNGPWYFDKASKKHYFNSKFTIEFMLEQDIPLYKVEVIDFVNHHHEKCNLGRINNCPESKFTREDVLRELLCYLIIKQIPLSYIPFKLLNHKHFIYIGLKSILSLFDGIIFKGLIKSDSNLSEVLVYSILLNIVDRKKQNAIEIASLFCDIEAVEQVLLKYINNISSDKIPRLDGIIALNMDWKCCPWGIIPDFDEKTFFIVLHRKVFRSGSTFNDPITSIFLDSKIKLEKYVTSFKNNKSPNVICFLSENVNNANTLKLIEKKVSRMTK